MTDKRSRIVVVGNTKGGSGKSTIAMHLIVACLRRGKSVASVDADVGQRTLTKYVNNRRAYGQKESRALPVSDHIALEKSTQDTVRAAHAEEQERFVALLTGLAQANDIVVIDTPGADTFLNRLCHTFADTLITPLNDSFVDLDVLAQVEGEALKITAPSHYSEMVWEQKIRRASAKRGAVDWVVLRNRLSNLDARNKRAMGAALDELSRRFGFRTLAGLGERVIYRELFPLGLTLLDLPRAGEPFQMAHVAARQEIRGFLEALRLF